MIGIGIRVKVARGVALLERAVEALEGIANAQMEIAESARRREKAADRSATFLQRFAEEIDRETSEAKEDAIP